MLARTVNDLSARVKERRNELGWSQSDLAAKVGVQRLWVAQFESGKATVQLGLVLRTLRVLDLELHLGSAPTASSDNSKHGIVDLDAVLNDNLNRSLK